VSIVSVSRRAAPPHFGQVTFTNSGASERRLARAGELDIERQHHRQLLVRHRHDAARRTVDHRDGRAPVALAGDAPVLDAVGDGAFAEALALGAFRSCAARLFAGQAGPLARVLHDAVVGEGLPHLALGGSSPSTGGSPGGSGCRTWCRTRSRARRARDGHDGAGAVAHQDEVADPDGHLLAAVRVDA
jgi:hypothetical protein